RWLKDHAAVLELQILTVGGKRFVEAATALDAIKRHAQVRTPERVEVDELAAMRARLGKRRRVA
ncbi:MAG TPA: hypothetical protein VGJ84_11870, partial [Polyangiaceae bacterium]